jgi:quinol monooxygenase YgiN
MVQLKNMNGGKMKIFRILCAAALGSSVILGALPTLAEDTTAPILDAAGYSLVATFTVKPDAKDAFIAAMQANVEASRLEPGVVMYRSYQSSSDPLIFVNVELYNDKAAFDAHLASAHVVKISEEFKTILAKDIDVVFIDAAH